MGGRGFCAESMLSAQSQHRDWTKDWTIQDSFSSWSVLMIKSQQEWFPIMCPLLTTIDSGKLACIIAVVPMILYMMFGSHRTDKCSGIHVLRPNIEVIPTSNDPFPFWSESWGPCVDTASWRANFPQMFGFRRTQDLGVTEDNVILNHLTPPMYNS